MKNFCPLPFTQLSLHSSGRVTPCCWLYDYELGSIKKNTIKDLWNSPKLQKLRQEFLEGKPVTCQENMQNNRCHHHHLDLQQNLEVSRYMNSSPKKVDLMLGGKCNLKCRMCENWQAPNGELTEENFWMEGRKEIFPFVEEIELFGGEPFIQDETFKLIDEVLAVNKKCRWKITTNAHYRLTPTIKKYLSKMTLDSLAISIDSLRSDIFEKIRLGGKLEQVLETFSDYLSYRDEDYIGLHQKNFVIVVNMLVQKDNFFEVPDFISFGRKYQVKLFLYLLAYPYEFSFASLDTLEKCEIIEYYCQKNRDLQSKVLTLFVGQLLKQISPRQQKIFFNDYMNFLQNIHIQT